MSARDTSEVTAAILAEGLQAVLEAADGMGMPEVRACEMAASYLQQMQSTQIDCNWSLPSNPRRSDVAVLIEQLQSAGTGSPT